MLSSTLLCAVLTVVALLVLRPLAARLHLVAHPQGHQTHDLPTPVVGGIGMAIGLGLTALISDVARPGPGLAVGALALVLLGIHDDRHGIRARVKFAAQAVIVAVALALDSRELQSLGELLPGVHLHTADLALPFTVFAILGVINATNMIDGLDGLAGQVLLVAFAWLAACVWLLGSPERAAGILAVAGAIAGFLAFNARFPGRPRALLFMGDAGSMLLGFLLAWTAVEVTQGPKAVPPVTVLWICGLPVIDTIAVALERKLRGRSSMTSGRDHLHHLLRARGLSVCQVALAEAGIGAAFGLVGVVGWRLGAPAWLMFALFAATGIAYHQAFRSAWKRARAGAAARNRLAEADSPV